MADDTAFRNMLESGWKNIGRKGSRAKLASTISKSMEDFELTKTAASAESSTGKDVSASVSSTSISMGSSSHKLGSWAKLLSKTSVGEPEPETVVQSADDSAVTLHEEVQVTEDACQASPSPANDEEVTEAMLGHAAEEDEADVVEETHLAEDNPEVTETAEGELLSEAMDVEDVEEAVLGDESAEIQEDADDMEEEEAAALAALEGKASSTTQKSDLAEKSVAKPGTPKPAISKVSSAKPKPAISKVSSVKPATPKPAVAKMSSIVEKPSVPKASTKPAADDDEDDCIIVDDDDGNTAGAEFRDALQDLPSGKVMKTSAKAQVKPKPPAGAPPKAITPAKSPGMYMGGGGDTKIAGGKIVRTNSGNVITPLVRTNSGNAGKITPSASAGAGGGETKIAGGKIIRTNSGNIPTPLVRTNSGKIMPSGSSGGGGEIKRINSASIIPAGGDLKRTNSGGVITPQGARNKQPDNAAKRARTDTGPIAAVDGEGRRYNLSSVVVNFANVGANYARKVLKRDGELEPQMLFDWEGVRRCVNYLAKNLGLKVVGVIYENFWATDNHATKKVELPNDIRIACESIEETPRIVGKNHGSADDEMTIKCAYHRNCRFMDNDNYRDWKQQLRDEKCRSWLDKCQDLLHMRYYFDSSMGVFETLDGNIPPGLLAPDGQKIPCAVSKRDLWTASNK